MRLQKHRRLHSGQRNPSLCVTLQSTLQSAIIVVWVSTEICRFHFRSVPFRQRHNHRPDWRSVRQQVSDSDNHYNDYRDNFLQTTGGSVRFSGIGYIPDLPVLLCNRRTCIHQGYLPECTSAAGILCNHGNRKHAVLLRIRQAAEI